MKTIEVYNYSELSAEAKEQALQWWRDDNHEIFWSEEIHQSWLEAIKLAGLNIKDYAIGAYVPGYICLKPFDGEDLAGSRALAWLENNLLGPLRIPWRGKKRWKVFRYGHPYRAGCVPPCPFTGYYFDDDIIAYLKRAVINGDSIKEAFESLAQLAQKTLESEIEAQHTEDYFKDYADANDYHFFKNGSRVTAA